MDHVGFVIGLLALLFLVFATLGIVVTVRAVRAVKRGVERTGVQVRRGVEDASLKARSMQPGPVGEVARIRLELRSSIDSTRKVLETGATDDPSLQEAVRLLDRLHDHARQVDGELHTLMQGEPDRTRIAQQLPDVRSRVTRIKESADSLRFAAQDRARRFDADGFASLREQIDIESGALRHWEEQPRRTGFGPPAGAGGGESAPERGSQEASGSAASGPVAGGSAAGGPAAGGPAAKGLEAGRERQEMPGIREKDAQPESRSPLPNFEKRRTRHPRSAS